MLKDMLLTKALMGSSGGGGGGSDSGVMIVTDNNGTLDYTWQEIRDSQVPVVIYQLYEYDDDSGTGTGAAWYYLVDAEKFTNKEEQSDYYYLSVMIGSSNVQYSATSADSYPVRANS